jgi:hypothetical protein
MPGDDTTTFGGNVWPALPKPLYIFGGQIR